MLSGVMGCIPEIPLPHLRQLERIYLLCLACTGCRVSSKREQLGDLAIQLLRFPIGRTESPQGRGRNPDRTGITTDNPLSLRLSECRIATQKASDLHGVKIVPPNS